MNYTGYQDVIPNRRPFLDVEDVLDMAQHVADVTGETVKHKALKEVGAAAARIAEVRAGYHALADSTQAALDLASIDFAGGKITAQQLLTQAALTASTLADIVEIRRLAESSTSPLNRAALATAREIGDAWLAPLKRQADRILEEASKVADEIGHEPRAQVDGVRHAGSRWSPSTDELEDMGLRHRWELLDSLLSNLDGVHYIADGLRNAGMVDCVGGREYGEDYRWLDADRLEGNPAEIREFFLANRGFAKPGIYTATELAAGAPPNVREQGVDKYDGPVSQVA